MCCLCVCCRSPGPALPRAGRSAAFLRWRTRRLRPAGCSSAAAQLPSAAAAAASFSSSCSSAAVGWGISACQLSSAAQAQCGSHPHLQAYQRGKRECVECIPGWERERVQTRVRIPIGNSVRGTKYRDSCLCPCFTSPFSIHRQHTAFQPLFLLDKLLQYYCSLMLLLWPRNFTLRDVSLGLGLVDGMGRKAWYGNMTSQLTGWLTGICRALGRTSKPCVCSWLLTSRSHTSIFLLVSYSTVLLCCCCIATIQYKQIHPLTL